MIDLVFDTNILVYLGQKNQKYLDFVSHETSGKKIGISVISSIEVLVWATTNLERAQLREDLSLFETLPLTEEIGLQCAINLSKQKQASLRNPKFADIIIANTALFYGVPLVTNNAKDFKVFKGLKVIVP